MKRLKKIIGDKKRIKRENKERRKIRDNLYSTTSDPQEALAKTTERNREPWKGNLVTPEKLRIAESRTQKPLTKKEYDNSYGKEEFKDSPFRSKKGTPARGKKL